MKLLPGILICITVLFSKVQAQKIDTTHIYFQSDNSFLSPDAEKKLEKLAAQWGASVKLTIIGYADYQGDAYYNDMLAMRRAQNIANFLEQKGLDKKNLKMVTGKGEVKRDSERKGGYREDRRVDIIVKHAPPPPEVKPVPKPAPPPPVKKDTVAPVAATKETIEKAEKGETLKIENLYFVGGRDIVQMGSEKALKDLYELMKESPKLKIRIEGHVCCTNYDEQDGTDLATGEDNLSEMRAKAVYDYLVYRGINASRLEYKGMARTMPVTRDESTNAMADLNRRVEIRIIEK